MRNVASMAAIPNSARQRAGLRPRRSLKAPQNPVVRAERIPMSSASVSDCQKRKTGISVRSAYHEDGGRTRLATAFCTSGFFLHCFAHESSLALSQFSNLNGFALACVTNRATSSRSNSAGLARARTGGIAIVLGVWSSGPPAMALQTSWEKISTLGLMIIPIERLMRSVPGRNLCGDERSSIRIQLDRPPLARIGPEGTHQTGDGRWYHLSLRHCDLDRDRAERRYAPPCC